MSSNQPSNQNSAEKKEFTTEEMLQEISRLTELLQKDNITEAEYLKEKEKLMNMMKS
ncbi:hypothetical protein ACWV26_09825 [Rummeliibacillus sp. JY-2-4R]